MRKTKLPDKIEVGSTTYIPDKLLGEGGFAYVYRCREMGSSGSAVAIKVVGTSDQESFASAEAELLMMKVIPEHEGIVKLLATAKVTVGRGHTELIFVEELLGSSLFGMMQKKQTQSSHFGNLSLNASSLLPTNLNSMILLEDAFLFNMTAQIGAALAHIHALDIVHRDCKPENFLVTTSSKDPNWHWKLVDFGSAIKGTALPETEEERTLLKADIEEKTSVSVRN